MVGDHYNDKFNDWKKYFQPPINPIQPYEFPKPLKPEKSPFDKFNDIFPVTREEFNQLKRDVEEMKKLLQKAKTYDEKNNEPDCELEEKMKFLRQIAEAVGINLDDVIKPKQ